MSGKIKGPMLGGLALTVLGGGMFVSHAIKNSKKAQQFQKQNECSNVLNSEPIGSYSQALDRAPTLQTFNELVMILEDVGRFYTLDPQTYTDIVFMCEEMAKVCATSKDPSIRVPCARMTKLKAEILAAMSVLRDQCSNSPNMLNTITYLRKDLEDKLGDLCHNVMQDYRSRFF